VLITKAYRREQANLHKNKRYGAASKKFAPMVLVLMDELHPLSILDYGAGKCALRVALEDSIQGIKFVEYDPGVKTIRALPHEKFDLVCCIDVLEHVEPQCLESVIWSLKSRVAGAAFITIHTGPAGKFLSDGRNAHLIQQPMEWWVAKLCEYFGSVDAGWYMGTTVIAVCREPK